MEGELQKRCAGELGQSDNEEVELGYLAVQSSCGESVAVPMRKGEPFIIKNVTVFAERANGGKLSVYSVKSGCDAPQRFKAADDEARNELGKRQLALVEINKAIKDLLAEAENSEDVEEAERLGQEMVKMSGEAGKHKRRIEELKVLQRVSYEYEEWEDRLVVSLSPAVICDLQNLVPGLTRVVWWPPLDWRPTRLPAVRAFRKTTKNGHGPPPITFDQTNLSPHLELSNKSRRVTKKSGGSHWNSNVLVPRVRSPCDAKIFSYMVQVSSNANTMLGWAPATLKSEIQQFDSCGFYVYQNTGNLFAQGGARHFNGSFAGSVAFQPGGILISTLDEGARTISFQLPGQEEQVIAFKNVPLGMQPAFGLWDEGAFLEFLE
eukprot:gb/GEZN01009198.1/.p1 GENE.gb/GEZN01009198.1/~~gb/GEZN01009198.1/.p1  ORF type:complete len:378 (+),score=57.81 gb/GEZN01009198.1/:90-1223(+)